MQTLEHSTPLAGMAEDDHRKVRAQLERLLDSHQFRNSRRYPALLRFIVEETLEGRGDLLKERLIGIHVFQRPPDYDTASDPIVRVNIAEVRKRIAQYYHDEEHDAEIRIELTAGRYAPEFRWRRDGKTETKPEGVEPALPEPGSAFLTPVPAPNLAPSALAGGSPAPQPLSPEAAPAQPAPRVRRLALPLAAALALLLLAAGALALHQWLSPSALDEFWAPILAPHRTVLFCLPTEINRKLVLASPVPANIGPTFFDHELLGENVVYSDVLAALNIVNTLNAHHTDYRVRLNIATSLDDLRHGPSILIGGLDNEWTLRATDKMPYRFAGSDEGGYWISYAKDPDNRSWALDTKEQYSSVTRDYALIARVHNEQTGEPQVILAGIGMSGTAAAGEMLGNEKLLQDARRRVGAGFRTRDFELVISTDVVNGIAGAPRIVAVAVW